MQRLGYLSACTHPVKLLGVFAKHWQSGSAKTRLAATIGHPCATEMARLFLEATLARFGDFDEACVLGFAPASEEAAFRELALDAWGLWPQPEGDLGERMKTFFELAAKEFRSCVLIGSDSPDLPKQIVAKAFEALNDHDAVLGPATDGGYYLLGIAGQSPPIFEDVAWGTKFVCEQTITRLQASKCRFQVLPPWHDVDDRVSLQALLDRLQESRTSDRWLARLADRLKGLLSDGAPV
jgi:uncharacterized protein